MNLLAENLAQLEEGIASACRRAGRNRAEVTLMAVSKTHPASTMAEAASLGLLLFGENRVQEFADKAPELATLTPAPTRVHLIGHLQSNKALRAVELFDGIDSVDSLKLAERLNNAATQMGGSLRAQSDGPGRGAVFTLEFPIDSTRAAEVATNGNGSASPEICEAVQE